MLRIAPQEEAVGGAPSAGFRDKALCDGAISV